CAVITTAQNGASEILDDKFVMKSSNDIDILTELNALLCDEDYLQSVKAQSRAIAEKFSVERNTQETLSILEKL
ncbi:MAG TPA: glycosyltransferase family 1 protein, partial [Campylobacterales bacterium]|nr:glycosyltransferase family 1 protein [Campylobacterales bacterium]